MKRYFACLYFESHVDDESNALPLTEESVRLVIADDESRACEKAEEFGKMTEHEYLNEEGSKVSWRFVRVVDVQEFCEEEFDDGVEVYSRLNRGQDSDIF